MENLTMNWTIVIFSAFSILYYIGKALRDVYFTKEKSAIGNLRYAIGTAQPVVTIEKHRKAAKKAAKYWHAVDATINAFVITILAFAFSGISWWIPLLLFLSLSIRWIVVDAFWNIFMKKPFFYTGTSSTMDQMTGKIWLQIAAKLFLLTISILTIVFYYKSQTPPL